ELHTVTSGLPGAVSAGDLFNGSNDAIGETFDVVFLEEGEFPYFSNIQDDIDAGMAGLVTVEAGAGESSDDGGAPIEVFSGSQDIDLVNLDVLSEILASATIPAGTY